MDSQRRWRPYTNVSEHEIQYLLDLLRGAPPGDVLVAGTYRGGDVMAMREVAPGRRYVVVDSFVGMSDPDPAVDGNDHPRGDFDAGGVDRYLRNFADAGFVPPEEVYPLYIDAESLRRVPLRPFALVWLDLDHYRPTLDCIRHVWGSVVPGGFVLTHDYGWRSCPGIARACRDSGLTWGFIQGYSVAYARK